MKMILIGILTLLTSNLIFAETNPMQDELERILREEGKSHFKALSEMFYSDDKKPSLKKLMNQALSGRCFNYKSENVAKNSGFLVRKFARNYEAYLYNEVNGDVDFFDHLNMQDIFVWNPALTSVQIDESFFAVKRKNGFSSFAQYDQYLIEEQTTFMKVPGRLFQKWVETGYCYYKL